MCCLGYDENDMLNSDPSLRLACPMTNQFDHAFTYNPDNEECKQVVTNTNYIDNDADGMFNPEVDEVSGQPEVSEFLPSKHVCCD